MKRFIVAISIASLVSAGCSSLPGYGGGQKEAVGTVVGAGTGALIGSQIGGGKGKLAAVAVGTLAGALLGQQVGKSLDRADSSTMQSTAQSSLESSRTYETDEWRNPDSGNSGTFTPTRTFQNESGQSCREYNQTVTIEGETQTAHGTACRQSDGSWLIVR